MWSNKDLEVKESLQTALGYIQDIMPGYSPLSEHDQLAKRKLTRAIGHLSLVFSLVWGQHGELRIKEEEAEEKNVAPVTKASTVGSIVKACAIDPSKRKCEVPPAPGFVHATQGDIEEIKRREKQRLV